MNYCPQCGTRLERRWVSADSRERLFCPACNAIRYQNPHILVSLMVTCGDKLLLCRRAHQPSLGAWTPPAGFMEQGETLERAAAREALEETGVSIDPEKLTLYAVTNLPQRGLCLLSRCGGKRALLHRQRITRSRFLQ
jgi:NADH pyrophosphatase NudC (nudix superfamily)